MLEGVVVRSIRRRSSSDRLGLRSGDVVLEINETEVTSVKQLEDIVSERQPRWELKIRRGSRELNVSVRG